VRLRAFGCSLGYVLDVARLHQSAFFDRALNCWFGLQDEAEAWGAFVGSQVGGCRESGVLSKVVCCANPV
jgi:hypothetical protein